MSELVVEDAEGHHQADGTKTLKIDTKLWQLLHEATHTGMFNVLADPGAYLESCLTRSFHSSYC